MLVRWRPRAALETEKEMLFLRKPLEESRQERKRQGVSRRPRSERESGFPGNRKFALNLSPCAPTLRCDKITHAMGAVVSRPLDFRCPGCITEEIVMRTSLLRVFLGVSAIVDDSVRVRARGLRRRLPSRPSRSLRRPRLRLRPPPRRRHPRAATEAPPPARPLHGCAHRGRADERLSALRRRRCACPT